MSDGDSIRKTWGNETVVQGYPVVPVCKRSVGRDNSTEDVRKESRKGHDIIQQNF